MNVAAILADPAYSELKRQILQFTGLSFYADKDEDLASRIARRLAARNACNCSQYLQFLRNPASGPQEMERVVGELTVGETYFFRQREHFDILRDTVFPYLLERNARSRSLRIWSAGCATGAEPYSIEMMLELELARQIDGWNVSILATDLNTDFLARAREARFSNWAFRETPEWVKTRCFERQGNSWVLRPEFRRRISFQHHNLAGDEPVPGAPFDVVLCRNVMIYFAPDLIRRTVSRFYDALAPGGWLLVGHAEPNMVTFARFNRVAVGSVTLYQKPDRVHARETPDEWKPPLELPSPMRPRPLPSRTAAPHRVTAAPTAPAVPSLDEVRLLADRGDWATAATLAKKLTDAEPLLAPAHFTLGLIHEHTASCAAAEASLRRAIYLDRTFLLAHYHLGTCFQRNQRPEQARKAFRNLLQLLSGRAPEDIVEHGDGMTVAELKELAKMHIELLEAA